MRYAQCLFHYLHPGYLGCSLFVMRDLDDRWQSIVNFYRQHSRLVLVQRQ